MAGRSKSLSKRAQDSREEKEKLIIAAIVEYQLEQEKPEKERKGLRKVCKAIQVRHYLKTGKDIKIDPTTLNRRVNGGLGIIDSNALKAWLNPEEADVIIEYVIEVAARGFPLSHRRLKEHVDEILKARIGEKFPVEGVGKHWTNRFVEKHSDRLSTYHSRPLDSVRGRAVNPTTNAAWFQLLGETIKKYDIAPACVYGSDESGFQPGCGTSECVIGRRGKTVQHQQRDGNRENITVLVTICADGTSIPPAVIFKGKAFLVKWLQDNPTKASCVPINLIYRLFG